MLLLDSKKKTKIYKLFCTPKKIMNLKTAIITTLFSLGIISATNAQTSYYSNSNYKKQDNKQILNTNQTLETQIDDQTKLGMSLTAETDKPIEFITGLEGTTRNTQINMFFKTHEEESKLIAEGRINQKIGKTNIILGAATDNSKYAGAQYGFLSNDWGAGIYYLKTNEKGEWRGQLWKQWNEDIFTGIAYRNGGLLTLLTKTSDNDFAARLANFTTKEKNTNNYTTWTALTIGEKSNPGYYGLNSGDSFFYINDNDMAGSEAVISTNDPFRYLPPTIGWLAKGHNAEIQHFYDSQSNTHWLRTEYIHTQEEPMSEGVLNKGLFVEINPKTIDKFKAGLILGYLKDAYAANLELGVDSKNGAVANLKIITPLR